MRDERHGRAPSAGQRFARGRPIACGWPSGSRSRRSPRSRSRCGSPIRWRRRSTPGGRWSGAIRSSRGHLPSFAAYRAPTEHPLWVAFGTLCAALGRAGARAMTLVVRAVAAGGRRRRVPARAAWRSAGWRRRSRACCLLSRFHFAFYAEFAYLDVPVHRAAGVGGGARGRASAPRRRRVGAARARRAAAPGRVAVPARYAVWVGPRRAMGAAPAAAGDRRAAGDRVGAARPDGHRRSDVLVHVHHRPRGGTRAPETAAADPRRGRSQGCSTWPSRRC